MLENSTNLEETCKFLSDLFSCVDTYEETVSEIKRKAYNNSKYLIDGLEAVENLLQETAYKGFFADLIEHEANLILEDRTDENAKKWLRELADTIRQILDNKAPPKR